MNRVFLSFSGRSASVLPSVAAALKGLGTRVYHYDDSRDRTLTFDGSETRRLHSEAASADIFIMLLDHDIGGVIDGDARGRHVLEYEFDCYLEACAVNHLKPPPIILSKKDPDATAELLKFVSRLHEADIKYDFVTDYPSVVRKAVQAYQAIKSHATSQLIHGYYDLDLIRDNFVDSVKRCISTFSSLPQKYLYATPLGAQLWVDLARNTNGAIGKVYDMFTFGPAESVRRNPDTGAAVATLSEALFSHIDEACADANHVSVVVLGCGDARREARICEEIKRRYDRKILRALLVDISKTLIGKSAERMREQVSPDLSVEFALIDFENPSMLRAIRDSWSPDAPVIILFLGNTLGNIDEISFLDNLAAALRDDDVIMIETLRDQSDGADMALKERQMPSNEPRFHFFASPIRMIGLHPRHGQMWIQGSRTNLGWVDRYIYQFSMADEDALRSCPIFGGRLREGNRVHLVDVQRVKQAVFEKVIRDRFPRSIVLDRSYTVGRDRVIRMLYAIGRK